MWVGELTELCGEVEAGEMEEEVVLVAGGDCSISRCLRSSHCMRASSPAFLRISCRRCFSCSIS